MSVPRTAASVLLSSALVAIACNEAPRATPTAAFGIPFDGPFDGTTATAPVPDSTRFVDLPGEDYSLPAGIAFQGRAVWVSHGVSYVNGTASPNARIITRYDLDTGRSTGSIPSPSDWTNCLGFDGTSLLAIDYTDAVRLFRLSPETGDVLSSFAIPWSPAFDGIAWDGDHLYVADHGWASCGFSTQITAYSACGEPRGVVYARSRPWDPVAAADPVEFVCGLTYADGTLWALVRPASPEAPYRLLRLSVEGAELSSVEIPGTAGRYLIYLGYDEGSFWTIEYVSPMSLADFSWPKRLVRLLP